MSDDVDLKILAILQENARTSNAEIAREIGMAPSATADRIRKLEERGVIQGYRAQLNPVEMGFTTLAFVHVSSTESGWGQKTFDRLAQIPEVLECHSIAGEDCFLTKVRARDTRHLNEILKYQITPIPSVSGTKTIIVLESNKESLKLPFS